MLTGVSVLGVVNMSGPSPRLMTSSDDATLQTGIPVLGVVENMSGLRQRADALRFFLPASPQPHTSTSSPTHGRATSSPTLGGATSSPTHGRATEGAAVSPTEGADRGLPVGQSGSGVSAAAAEVDVTEQVLAALRQVAPQLEVSDFFRVPLQTLNPKP